MSTATKVIQAGQVMGYQIGRLEAQREDWMRLARRSRDMGHPSMERLRVKFARQTNQDLVRKLRDLRLINAKVPA